VQQSHLKEVCCECKISDFGAVNIGTFFEICNIMMIKKIWFFISVTVIFSGIVSAQTLQLVNSIAQSWSGGIAGRHGTNYTFVFDMPDSTVNTLFDTLWLEGEPRGLPSSVSAGEMGVLRSSSIPKGYRYEINLGTAHNDYENRTLPVLLDTVKRKSMPSPPIPVNGVALLVYRENGLKKFLRIPKILIIRTPVAYP
jgi:hypothetical protein